MTDQVVPWVTAWSLEMQHTSPVAWSPMGIAAPDGQHLDMLGVTWLKMSNEPGSGEPMFSQVHTLRQIRCMRGPRCQVCGERLGIDGAPVPWLLNGATDTALYDLVTRGTAQALLTQTPPTCESCIPRALLRCPHLSALANPITLHVTSYEKWGVQGDLYADSTTVKQGEVLPFHHPYLRWMLGRQMVVKLTEFIEVGR